MYLRSTFFYLEPVFGVARARILLASVSKTDVRKCFPGNFFLTQFALIGGITLYPPASKKQAHHCN